MEAEIILIVSAEKPLMTQISKIFARMCCMCEFTTIDKNDKYVTLQHIETGRIISYTTEERLILSFME